MRLQIIFSSCQKSTDPNCSLSSRGVRCSVRLLVQLRQQSIRGSTKPGDRQALWKRFRVLQEAFLKPNPEQRESFCLPREHQGSVGHLQAPGTSLPRSSGGSPRARGPVFPVRVIRTAQEQRTGTTVTWGLETFFF